MNGTPYAVRPALPSDLTALAGALQAYMAETYEVPWSGSAAALQRDLDTGYLIQVAISATQLIGFLAWAPSYDLHHCIAGGEVLDLYIIPEWRGRGVAVGLGCAAAAAIAARGGQYLKGSAVERGSSAALYARVAACSRSSECVVSGRAFRRLAELAGRPPRAMAAGLPVVAWNYEA